MCKAVIKGGLVGGIISYIWYSISWMLLPWHTLTIHGFKNESALAQTIIANAPTSGMYFMPMQQNMAAHSNLPFIFASVHLEGMTSMTLAMVTQVVMQIIVAGLVTWLVSKATNLSYWQRVGFIMVFAIATTLFANIPNWGWFGFSTDYTLVQMADALISWFLAGLAIAKCAENS